MEKQPTKQGKVLLLIGLLFLILSLTVFRENNTPKFLMLGASIGTLFASIYINTKSSKENDSEEKK